MNGQYELRNNLWWDAFNNEWAHSDEDFKLKEYLLIDRLNFCGCLDFELIIPAIDTYLTKIQVKSELGIFQFNSNSLEEILIAALCDSARFTKHGGNIIGSWITDEGRAWLTTKNS